MLESWRNSVEKDTMYLVGEEKTLARGYLNGYSAALA